MKSDCKAVSRRIEMAYKAKSLDKAAQDERSPESRRYGKVNAAADYPVRLPAGVCST